MKEFLDISDKIEPQTVKVLKAISEITDYLSLSFMIIGATARDMILEKAYDKRISRATLDLDLGVKLAGWDTNERLMDKLVGKGNFSRTGIPHRLKYRETYSVDIIPFGNISDEDFYINWNTGRENRLNTLPIEEAFKHPVSLKFAENPDFTVKSASLEGLLLMKFFSWKQTTGNRSADARDIRLILLNYLDAGNLESLYTDYPDLVDVENFDYEFAGAELAGREMVNLFQNKALKYIISIIKEDSNINTNLINDMHNYHFKDRYSGSRLRKLLESFLDGLESTEK